MDFYEDSKSVSEYIKMCSEYNGKIISKEIKESDSILIMGIKN